MKYCPKCGAELEDDVKFCSECGADLENTESKEVAEQPKEKQKSCVSGIVLGALAAVTGLIIPLIGYVLAGVGFGITCKGLKNKQKLAVVALICCIVGLAVTVVSHIVAAKMISDAINGNGFLF